MKICEICGEPTVPDGNAIRKYYEDEMRERAMKRGKPLPHPEEGSVHPWCAESRPLSHPA
jgi:hypothetical protein